jgi:hypothetical protein
MNRKKPLRFADSWMAVLKTVGRAGFICGALVSTAFAKDTCGMESFSGAYAFTATGFVLPALTTGEFGFGGGEGAVPIQGVQLITSDGNGNLTDKESLNLGGQPLAATAAHPFSPYYGSYTVNADCTGTAFLTNAKYICPNSPGNCPTANFLHWAFILGSKGKKVRMVAVPPYDSGGVERVITSVGAKMDDAE